MVFFKKKDQGCPSQVLTAAGSLDVLSISEHFSPLTKLVSWAEALQEESVLSNTYLALNSKTS